MKQALSQFVPLVLFQILAPTAQGVQTVVHLHEPYLFPDSLHCDKSTINKYQHHPQ